MDKVVINPSGILSLYLDSSEVSRKPILPRELSFLEIDNDFILLSIVKQSERGKSLIIRVYNISSNPQSGRLIFSKLFKIKEAKLVNLLEEQSATQIKADVNRINDYSIQIEIQPNVIATIKIQFEKN
jgi:alpha-mannosidase